MISSTSPQAQRKSQETEKLVLVNTDLVLLDTAFKCVPSNKSLNTLWAFAGGVAPVAGDVSVGDGSRQADAASPRLPFCAMGRQDTMPSPMHSQVRGALGHPGCFALAPPWAASTVWVLETPSLGVSPAPGSVSQGQALQNVLLITGGLKNPKYPLHPSKPASLGIPLTALGFGSGLSQRDPTGWCPRQATSHKTKGKSPWTSDIYWFLSEFQACFESRAHWVPL